MAVDYRTHLRDDRSLPGTGHNRGQMKRSWDKGVEDMKSANGVRRPGHDNRYRDALTWGDIGRMLGYFFGPMPIDEQDRLYELAADWGAKHDAWKRTRNSE